MKKRKVILPLLALPFLMGNSPAPYTHSIEGYNDFEISNLSQIDEETFQVDIKNTGNGFIDLGRSYFEGSRSYYGVRYYNDELLGPNQTLPVQFYGNEVDLSTLTYFAYSFTDADEEAVSVTKFNLSSKTASSDFDENDVETKTYTYTFDYTVSLNKSIDYEYVIVLEVEYDGETHFYYSRYSSDYIGFSTLSNLTKDQVTFKKAYVAKGEVYHYQGIFDDFNFPPILRELLILFIFFPLGGGLVAGLVIMIIMINKHKKNKKNKIEQEANNRNNKVRAKKEIVSKAKNETNKVSKKHKK